jgi:hypothetical protein
MADPTPEELAAHVRNLTPEQKAALVKDFTADEMVEILRAHPRGDVVLTTLNQNRNEVMVALINSHNPYTDHAGHEMSVFVGNPNPDDHHKDNINQVELEVDGPYSMPMEWNFKGSPQKINKTLRIKYRYRARNLDIPNRPLLTPPHWVTAYLLIGFEDGGF